MNYNLIDTHFHLDFYRNHNEIYNTINRKKQITLCMTNSPGIYISCRNLYKETKYVKFALGFHPLNNSLTKYDFEHFLKLAKESHYIGEVGLDLKSSNAMKIENQIYYFDKIVELCSKENKILSVHVKGAEKELIEILTKYKPLRCIIHWYNGPIKYLNKLIELGCYFSVNSNMITNKQKINKVCLIPRNKLLIESDGPFTKVNNKKYYPGSLIDVYTAVEIDRNEKNLKEKVFNNFETILAG